MWIFLSDSFLSIVAHRLLPDMLLVRARQAGDIETIFPAAAVEYTPERDYHYRTVLPRHEVSQMLSHQIEWISYDNFKNSVGDDYRHGFYFRAYNAMFSFGQQVRRGVQRRFGY